ncbi:MAG: integrase arm-type DNA-binding domain-containing protein [Sphingopyxis sp.]|nr:integrase arm-type DNA-binding domain-containing protein [Sphingopyxis sp.]
MTNLTALKVKNARPGTYGDGKGLYLRVKPSGSRSWILRVQHQGRRQDIGLGSVDYVTLAEARDAAARLRRVARLGDDAIAERDRGKIRIVTFQEAVALAYAELGKGWTEKTALQFKASLDLHAVPSLGGKRVGDIETSHILGALAPIWTTKPQIARKVRHRILQVLAFAKSNGWRSKSVPEIADLSRGLAKQPKSKGYSALPFPEVPKFFASERVKEASPARLALMFTILTAARSGEVRKADWTQVDLRAREWRRPASIMKSGEPHVVMLSDHAAAVLKLARDRFGDDGLIFPSRNGLMLTDMSLSRMMKLAGRSETVHGFRSSFRDWAAEKLPHVPAMVPEMALAHSVGTAVEKAYLRSDLKALRLQLMTDWGAFVMAGNSKLPFDRS